MDPLAQEGLEKVRGFADDHKQQFNNFNEWYKLYRCQPGERTVGKSNTFIPEIFTEIEALSTAIYEMLFSDSSESNFFDVYPNGYHDAVKAFLTKSVITDQIETVELSRKIMPWIRGLVRDGYAAFELPWTLEYGYKKRGPSVLQYPKYDCWDFQYVRPADFSFATGCYAMEHRDWACRSYTLPYYRAKSMERMGLWENVDKALSNGSAYTDEEKARRTIAGLSSESSQKMLRYHDMIGYFESGGQEYRQRLIFADNGAILSAAQINPYDDGEYPWLESKWIEAEQEEYGIGVVEINARQQREVNDRRNYVNDTLYAALYNMWKLSTDAGYKSDGGKIIWEAFKVLEMDNTSGLEPLRPPIEGIPYANRMEESDREAMRRQSGATSTLQGISQNMTATESQIVQNEATRRLRATVRSQIAGTLRKMLYKVHSRNLQFLDRKRVIRAEGPEGEQMFAAVDSNSLSLNPYFKMKISTDMDFRIFQKKELLEFLQGFAQLAKTQGFTMDPKPIIEKLALSFNMNPRDFKRELDINRAMTNPEVQKKAVGEIIASSPRAQEMMQKGGLPPEDVVGGMGIAQRNALAAGAGLQ